VDRNLTHFQICRLNDFLGIETYLTVLVANYCRNYYSTHTLIICMVKSTCTPGPRYKKIVNAFDSNLPCADTVSSQPNNALAAEFVPFVFSARGSMGAGSKTTL
jgi:hypothetical protein